MCDSGTPNPPVEAPIFARLFNRRTKPTPEPVELTAEERQILQAGRAFRHASTTDRAKVRTAVSWGSGEDDLPSSTVRDQGGFTLSPVEPLLKFSTLVGRE